MKNSTPTRLCWTLLYAVVALSLWGKDRPGMSRQMMGGNARAAEHEGFSPFPPPDEDDTLFTVDSGDDLDTDCTYHSGSPLIIHLPVSRYVGPVKPDGTLRDASSLVARHLLSETAHLRLPAYDVDVFGDPTDPFTPPEIDRIYFNGHLLGSLTGDDEIWKLNEFVIPIEWVRLPASKGVAGAPPTPADNEIRIEIDVASVGEDNWCTSIDWAELDFAAIAPTFLVHGILSDGLSAWPHFAEAFTAADIPFSNAISVAPRGSIEGNALSLATQLKREAAAFGARRCHIVAHSKGGLDTRAYLAQNYDSKQLRVLSFYTLSTPHHGSVLADIGVLTEAGAYVLLPAEYAILEKLIEEQLAFVGDLSSLSTALFNLRYPTPPNGILFYHYGADADADGSGTIDPAEAAEFGASAPVANLLYHVVGKLEGTVTVTFGQQAVRLWGDASFQSIDIQVEFEFAKNDVVVTTASAHMPSGNALPDRKANHSSIKSADLARQIVDRILADFPNR